MFSDGARIVGEMMRLPLRIRCVHWVENWALKRDSLQGRMSWIESGTVIGLVERNEEYQESRSSSPMIILAILLVTNTVVWAGIAAYLLVDSTLLQIFHLRSISGTVSKRVMSRICPSVTENNPCLWATYSSCH